MILSLQGCMAVGKTTAAQLVAQNAPYIHVSYENNTDVAAVVKQRGLDKGQFADYLEIQKLYLQKEIKRWEDAAAYPCTLMDFGPEEIEFYTLHYPRSIGKNWPVEEELREELEAIRACEPKRILFLDASPEVLWQRKAQDTTRSRSFFPHYVQDMLPLKRDWFFHKENVDVLNVDHMGPEEVSHQVQQWCDFWIGTQKSGNVLDKVCGMDYNKHRKGATR